MRNLIIAAIIGVLFMSIYIIDTDVWAADNAPAKKDAVPKADDKQAAAVPTEAEFMKVINDKCLRCHRKACTSLDTMKQMKWVVPGKPENSPAYKVIGKNRKPGGTYHNLTDAEKKVVNDFIKNMN